MSLAVASRSADVAASIEGNNEVALLLQALRGSGSAEAAARFVPILRKWARDGRPYRNKVFTEAHVEAAVRAFETECSLPVSHATAPRPVPMSAPTHMGATSAHLSTSSSCAFPKATAHSGESRSDMRSQMSQAPSMLSTTKAESPHLPLPQQLPLKAEAENTGKHFVCLKAPSWPPQGLDEVAISEARALGPVPVGKASKLGMKLLPALLNYALSTGNDISVDAFALIEARDGATVCAHRSILAAQSPFLSCKFDGRFGDAHSKLVNAKDFAVSIVRAVVSFAYLGFCSIELADVGALYALADVWHLQSLLDVIVQYVHTLPAVLCLCALVGWDSAADRSKGLGDALAARAAARLVYAASKISTVACLAVEAPRSKEEAADINRKIFEANAGLREPGWRFVSELGEVLCRFSVSELENLRRYWIIGEGRASPEGAEAEVAPLAEPLIKLYCAALGVACRREELLLLRPLGVLLSDDLTQVIVERLCVSPGIRDPSGELQYWVDWVADGNRPFNQLWLLYSLLRGRLAEDAQVRTERQVGAPGEDAQLSRLQLVSFLESDFGLAFANSIEGDLAAATRWEQLLDANHCYALEESFQILSRLSHRTIGRLPPTAVLRILREASQKLPSGCIHISEGPAELRGLYTASDRGAAGLVFSGPGDLVLRRIWRKGPNRASIVVWWDGIPKSILHDARCEWKIHHKDEDPDAGEPLALALEEADCSDPIFIKSPWWLRVGNRKRYQLDIEGGMKLQRELALASAVAPFAKALASWARRGGSLPALTKVASEGSHHIVLQICKVAASLPRAVAPDIALSPPSTCDPEDATMHVEASSASIRLENESRAFHEDILGAELDSTSALGALDSPAVKRRCLDLPSRGVHQTEASASAVGSSTAISHSCDPLLVSTPHEVKGGSEEGRQREVLMLMEAAGNLLPAGLRVEVLDKRLAEPTEHAGGQEHVWLVRVVRSNGEACGDTLECKVLSGVDSSERLEALASATAATRRALAARAAAKRALQEAEEALRDALVAEWNAKQAIDSAGMSGRGETCAAHGSVNTPAKHT